jgi:hypothetical protein
MTTYMQYIKMDSYLDKGAINNRINNRRLNKRAFAMYKETK